MLFVNIETVPGAALLSELPAVLQAQWERKASFIAQPGEAPGFAYQRAGIYAEFGQVVCVSLGMVTGGELKAKSIVANSERELLEAFAKAIDATVSKYKDIILVAHHGREFDFPFLARRMIINGVKVPAVFSEIRSVRKKPRFVDVLSLWKFGDYKNFTPLELLAAILGIPIGEGYTPSSDNYALYWEKKDIDAIQRASEERLRLTVEVFTRLNSALPLV